MPLRSLTHVFLLCISLVPAQALVERTIERTFPVPDRASVNVDTFYGSIQVVPTHRPEVKVVVRQLIDAADEADADRQLRELDFNVEGTAEGRVTLIARSRKRVRWTWDKWPPIGLSIEISVPDKCDLHLVSREGALTVGNLQGTLDLRALQGSIFVGEVEGSLVAWSGRGDVAVTACTGALELTARAGNVVVGRALGPTRISQAGGAVEVQAARGTLHVEAEGSDLKVGFVHPLRGNSDLRGAGGNVIVSFDARSSATLEIRASLFGKITVRDLPLTVRAGALNSSRLEADLKGGGPKVSVHASGGNVRLLTVPAWSAE